MAPPLISEYKQDFVLKRLFETFLGGPRFFSPISFVAIQILLFSIPAFLVSIVNLFSLDVKWKCGIVGISILLTDLSLGLIILLLKKSRNNVVQSLPSVRVSDADGSDKNQNGSENGDRLSPSSRRGHREHVTSFLSQEDMVPNEGCHKPSTWLYIAPNPTISMGFLLALMTSSFAFLLCTPLMISEVISPVLRGFAIFAMCNAHYSAIINSPPEIAIFDTTSPEKRHILYRIFYPFLVGLTYIIFAQFSPDPQQDHCVLSWLSGIIAFFPLLWGIGILPDPSALFPWALGTLLLLLGGTSPSFHYAGTLVSLSVVGICPILVFIITRESLKIVLAECICGYIISCDTGRIIFMNSALCEDIPTKSFLRQLLYPFLNVATSLLCIFLTWLFLGPQYEDVVDATTAISDLASTSSPYPIGYEIALISTTLTIAFASWAFRYWAMSQTDEFRKVVLIPVHLLHGSLTFLLHIWLSLTILHERLEWTSVQESDEARSQSLARLVPYLLTIRGFALAISEPRKSVLDFSLAFWIRSCLDASKAKSSFVLILFICSLVTGRIKRFFRACKTFCSIWYAFSISTIMGSNKTRLVLISVALLPVSLWSLLVAVVVEGVQLIPIFTLPIFLLGSPRPSSTFWRESWFPGKRCEGRRGGGNNSASVKHVPQVETVDWKIYSEIGPLLASGISRKAHLTKFSLERGDCFLVRYEDRLLFIRVASSGWNYAYLQIKGLEMQEQTSCHHHEAAKVDEIFDAVLNPERSTCSKLALDFLSLLILSPMCSLNLPTYSESKSNIYALAIPEEKSTFRDMFYRAFSYMWIKNNPALKGEAYQNGLNRKTIAAISTNSFSTSNDAIPSTDAVGNTAGGSGGDQQSTPSTSTTSTAKPDAFSVKHALVNFTKPTVDFFKRRDSVDQSGGGRRNSTATTTIVSAVSGADAVENNGKESDVNSLLEDEEVVPEPVRRRSVISRQSTVTSMSMSQGGGGSGVDFASNMNTRRFSMTTPLPARLVDVESENGGGLNYLTNNPVRGGRSSAGGGGNNKDVNARLSTIWVKQCVGDVIPSNAVRARVEKICNSVWDSVVGLVEEKEIELSEFFQDDFLLKLKRLISSSPRIDMEQITLKAFRYACKLTLDEIFSSTNYASKVITIDADQEEEIFTQLNQFERDYQFCSPQEIPFWMQQNAGHIVTMNKSEEKSIMRILNYESDGVEFKVGQLDQCTCEGIWANLNLELLYLTSDDDERFSIQNDRVLLRNMMTQCAKAPLGYPVYDALFRVNLHSFNVTQIN